MQAGGTGRDLGQIGLGDKGRGCPSAFQAGGGVATPSLPGGRPSSSASPQRTAGCRRKSGGWRWTVELQQYDVHYATTYIYSLNKQLVV